ncbi:MAG: CHAT domain-containing protein, partial [Chloroflexi bacterium]|nr:CHAT domain-containing protein [Chloroflexota bacterium]
MTAENRPPDCLEFEIEIGHGRGRSYPIAVRSPAGEAREQMRFPFDELALENRLQALQIALLQSGGTRRAIPTSQEETVKDFGKALFDTLLSGEIRNRYDVSRMKARQLELPLRLKLRIDSPQLAALPWEFLYDSREGAYLSLSLKTPIVRYPSLAQPLAPLPVKPPLRILGMIVSPTDLPELDVDRERQRLEEAVKALPAVELQWLQGQTWRDLMQAMGHGPWHILHFIGHGGFDARTDEGMIVLSNPDGTSNPLRASQLTNLVADHFPLRFVFLNACEGARGSTRDVFSSTAANLVQNGVPAVLAMQYEISDAAAIEFSRTFYEALASDIRVDEAVTQARKAIRLASQNSVEWGTPVLYMHTTDALLFSLGAAAATPSEAERARIETEQRLKALEERYAEGVRDSGRGRWAEALRIFEDIQRKDPGFRDLPQRLAHVRDALTRSAAPPPNLTPVQPLPEPRTPPPQTPTVSLPPSAPPAVQLRPPATGGSAHLRPVSILSGHARPITSIAFSPNVAVLASASIDQTVRLWSVPDSRLLHTLSQHAKQVNHVTFSPDGQFVASASGGAWGQADCVIRLWRVQDGVLLTTLAGHTGQVLESSFSPDGRRLASAGADATVRLWDLATGRPVFQLTGHTKQVRSVAFSPTGQLLASKANDGTIRLWRVADGGQYACLQGCISIANMAFSPDGAFIASGSFDGNVRIWRIADGALAFNAGGVKQVNFVAFSRDGRLLACAAEDATVRIWRLTDGSALPPLTGHL